MRVEITKRTLLWLSYGIVVGLLIWGGLTHSEAKGLLGSRVGQNHTEADAQEPVPVKELITTPGLITSIDENEIIISLESVVAPKNIFLQGRPYSFARDRGLILNQGDQIDLTGFIENDSFEFASIHNLTNGSTVKLRDLYVRPAWSIRDDITEH